MLRIITILLFFFFISLHGEIFRVYHVGNSLTWDSQPGVQAQALEAMGYTVNSGYHIACSKGLTYIEAHPDYTCVDPPNPYGKWQNALGTHEWDAVTLQVFYGGNGATEVAATQAIIEHATAGGRNQDCVFYLYMPWPGISDTGSFEELFLKDYTGSSSPVSLTSGFLDYWYDSITTLFPELDIRVIPTGFVFAHIDAKLREIAISPYTNTYDLYRDAVHMSYRNGRHVATSSMLTALTGVHPKNHVFPTSYTGNLTPEFVELSNEVIWYTQTADSRTQIISQPDISLNFRSAHNLLEISFTGSLHFSDDLINWETDSSITSPYRLDSTSPKMFFKSIGN